MEVTLKITDLDYSTWSNQGQDGVWLGIGFGELTMAGSDIVMCQFLFSGISASNSFICSDRYSSSYSTPTVDTIRNVEDVDTVKIFNDGTKLCDLSATFTRKINTGDTA